MKRAERRGDSQKGKLNATIQQIGLYWVDNTDSHNISIFDAHIAPLLWMRCFLVSAMLFNAINCCLNPYFSFATARYEAFSVFFLFFFTYNLNISNHHIYSCVRTYY
jgi:hypothetical protein